MKISTILLLPVIGVLLETGCGTTTGTKTELDTRALAEIKTLEVQVVVEQPFSVYLAQGKDASTGWLVGGIIGSAIEKSIQSGADAADTKRFQPLLKDFDCQSCAQQNLKSQLQKIQSISSVVIVEPGSGAGASTTHRLVVRFHQWGLMGGTDKDGEKKALTAVTGLATLTDPKDRKLWEHEGFAAGGGVHSWSEYNNSPDLLRKETETAVQRYCNRIGSELRYAR